MKRTLATAFAGLIASLLAVPALATRADAAPARGVVFVTMMDGTPVSTYSTNGSVSTARTDVGRYTIWAAQVAGTGHAHLSVWDTGSNPAICTVSNVSRFATGTRVRVRCWDAITAEPADAMFSLLYASRRARESAVPHVALTTYTMGSSTPSNQHRAVGAARAVVRRLAVGSYRVRIPRSSFAPSNGIVMTSATGMHPRWCNPTSWGPNGLSGTDVYVECRRPGGSLANSTFSLTITAENLLTSEGAQGGSLWSDAAARSTAPSAVTAYSYNGAAVPNEHVDLSTGVARVRFPGVLGGSGELAAFTVGYGPHRCALQALAAGVDATLVTVACRTAAGEPVDSSFDAFAQYLLPTVAG